MDGRPQRIAQLLGAARHGRKPDGFKHLGRRHLREKLAQSVVFAGAVSYFQTDDEICHVSTKMWTKALPALFSRICSMPLAAKKKPRYR